jgi:hydrogenase expression/formation protein HypD
MKYVTEFRDSRLVKSLVTQISLRSKTPVRLMEFCGGHTVSIFRYGLRQLLPKTVELVSGPGCPVCVTATSELDRAIALAELPDVMVTTFGDMFRVPASHGSLQEAKARGADVRMVYSTLDALDLARKHPDKKVIFLGIGFETTAPTIAASLLTAQEEGVTNFYVESMHKVCPPILRAILAAGEIHLQGLICPGHVSAIIGSNAWAPTASEFALPCVVAGFEPVDILQAVLALVEQVEQGIAVSDIAYSRGVTPEGNPHAQRILAEVFERSPGNWRGVGVVPGSGLAIRESFAAHDAKKVFRVELEPSVEPAGCICGAVLRGANTPFDCNLFGKLCTPASPVGPCMVSSEGSCSAYYRYGRDEAVENR